jgi:hypothetical protein
MFTFGRQIRSLVSLSKPARWGNVNAFAAGVQDARGSESAQSNDAHGHEFVFRKGCKAQGVRRQ